VDIWKDVAGFMTADPKWVKNPRVIHTLSYREAAELSYFGARILHPRTFEPVMEKSIPIRLFDINHFNGQLKPLSTIEDNGYVKEDVVKSVTFSDDLGILKLRGPGVGIKPGIMAKVTHRLNSARINIKSIITAQTSINILVSLDDLQRSLSIINEIGLKAVDEIIAVDNISLIAVVGEGMLEKPGIAARVFGAVSSQNINILIISSGASVVASYFIIESKNRGRAIQAIHKEFFT
jgi:aspartate kinase/aspartokinase/homoserine dehydrogenase 1